MSWLSTSWLSTCSGSPLCPGVCPASLTAALLQSGSTTKPTLGSPPRPPPVPVRAHVSLPVTDHRQAPTSPEPGGSSGERVPSRSSQPLPSRSEASSSAAGTLFISPQETGLAGSTRSPFLRTSKWGWERTDGVPEGPPLPDRTPERGCLYLPLSLSASRSEAGLLCRKSPQA